MKDLDLNFPLDKFEELIVDIGWESLDSWFNFWDGQKIFFQLINFGKIK